MITNIPTPLYNELFPNIPVLDLTSFADPETFTLVQIFKTVDNRFAIRYDPDDWWVSSFVYAPPDLFPSVESIIDLFRSNSALLVSPSTRIKTLSALVEHELDDLTSVQLLLVDFVDFSIEY